MNATPLGATAAAGTVAMSGTSLEWAIQLGQALAASLSTVLLGKEGTVGLVAASVLAGGHVLLEDDPGVGKTLLAKAVARSIAGRFARVQGSVDLLPSDVTGVSVFDPATTAWEFRPGPLFSNVVLFDEINRATPRAQSALLEGMAEGQVSVDGITRPLPSPFLVIATQNPYGDAGTFPLPAGQRDRFAVLVSVGRPDRDSERRVLHGDGGESALAALRPIADVDQWAHAQAAVGSVHAAPGVVDYVLDVLDVTRNHADVAEGASPRAGLALLRVARALALIAGRDYVLADDVKRAAVPVLAHRVTWKGFDQTRVSHSLVDELLRTVPVPVPTAVAVPRHG